MALGMQNMTTRRDAFRCAENESGIAKYENLTTLGTVENGRAKHENLT
jgi:hypothetical protein